MRKGLGNKKKYMNRKDKNNRISNQGFIFL